MRILLVEPYATGSHMQWASGYQKHSKHEVELLTLPGRHWKWRMHGAAVTLAKEFNALQYKPDLILATDMIDLATFLGLVRDKGQGIPVALYFHENQITYPWSATDSDPAKKRDHHYGHINLTSALAADRVFFNSKYHLSSFMQALPAFLKMFPDHQNLECCDALAAKSSVIPLGMDLKGLEQDHAPEPKQNRAVILWNHRWEYDKNPDEFFDALFRIQDRGWDFKLVVLGENFGSQPKVFDEAKKRLENHILHWGYTQSRAEYAQLVSQCDILPVTSIQDFFGGSIVEAMYLNVKPLLPKRLAYSEHIPKAVHNTFFYDEGALVDKLQRWIKDVSVLRKQQTRTFVEQYDWSLIAGQMDSEFERMMTL